MVVSLFEFLYFVRHANAKQNKTREKWKKDFDWEMSDNVERSKWKWFKQNGDKKILQRFLFLLFVFATLTNKSLCNEVFWTLRIKKSGWKRGRHFLVKIWCNAEIKKNWVLRKATAEDSQPRYSGIFAHLMERKRKCLIEKKDKLLDYLIGHTNKYFLNV